MTPDAIRTRYELLLEVSESIAAYPTLHDLLHALSPTLARLVPFAGWGLMLYHADRHVTRLYHLESSLPHRIPLEREFPADQTPTAVVLETKQPLYLPDLAAETRFPVVTKLLLENAVASYCVLPLFTERRQLGSLSFGSTGRHAYGRDEIEFMRQVARQVAVAVENTLNYESAAHLQRELARERDRLRLLLEVNNAVVAHLETEALFEAVSASLRQALKVDRVSLVLWDDRRLGEDMPNPCSIPLTSGGRTLGTLNVAAYDRDMTTDEVALLHQVAGQIAIAMDNAAAYRRIQELNAHLAQEKLYLADEIRTNYFFEEVIGRSPALAAVLQQVEMVAASDSTVLICGETGTGKELIARAIHRLSPRCQNTFVKANCSAIPMGLLESELFGHEKGAFTGAVAQRIGRFELAHRGTLFLDEIGDIPLEGQPKLLRVLQEGEFERLGSTRTLRVDVRLVAATNRDLMRLVEDGRFRADLYYRLNVFPIVVPPLRDRAEDIPLLVGYFVQQYAARMGKQIASIPSEAMQQLVRYPWPGNIRELQNLIERAVILSRGSVLQLPLEVLATPPDLPASVGTLDDAQRRHILQTLNDCGWVIAGPHGAAARLGMKRSTLQFRMKKLGIARPQEAQTYRSGA